MSLLDVIRGDQTWGNWLTGKDSDLNLDTAKADAALEELSSIAGTTVVDAGNSVTAAVSALSSVNGIGLLGVSIAPVSNFASVFDQVGTLVTQVRDQLQSKYDSSVEYSEAKWYEKGAATLLMGLANFGEGVLSVAEDLGDGVCSVIGWGASKVGLDGVADTMTKVVESDWSHDVFDWAYYSRDFAKKSLFTEDSAIAGACRIGGQAVGYLYAGGAAKGLFFSPETAAVGKGLLRASTSTWGATIAAGVGGLGSGTEAGLYKQEVAQRGHELENAWKGTSGVDIAHAVEHEGLATAAMQAALAFGGGKLSERAQYKKALKEAEENLAKQSEAKEAYKAAVDAAKKVPAESRKAPISAQEDIMAAREAAMKAQPAVRDAQEALDAIVEKGASGFQGYHDVITNAGDRFGSAVRETASSGRDALVANARALGARGAEGGIVRHAAEEASQTFRESASTLLRENPVSQLGGALKNTAASIGNAEARAAARQAAREAVSTAAKHPLQTAAKVGKSAVRAVVENPEIAATVAYNIGDEMMNGRAEEQFRNSSAKPDSTPAPTSDPTPDPTPDPTTDPTPDPTSTPAPTPGGGGGGYPYSPQTPTDPTPAPSTTPDPIEPVTPTTEPTPTSTPVPTSTPDPQVIVDSPTPENPGPTPTSTPTPHTGVGYNGENGDTEPELSDLMEDATTSIEDIIKGNKYSKIPTSSKPITAQQSGNSGSAVIPIAAGLSAAAAAGIGAKAYMDHKNNNDNDDEIYTDEWSDEDTIALDEDQSSQEQYLEEDYNYQEIDSDKYGARNNEELADLQ